MRVVDYDDDWPRRFEQLRARIWPSVADVALRIEHVGSTSVPGLAAKPTIDMTLVVLEPGDIPLVIDRLATPGYCHQGDLGIEGREAFEQPAGLPPHHLYACAEGAPALINHIAFRDYLRVHSDDARRYGELKKQLAARFPEDRHRYTIAKTGFVLDALRRAGLTDEQFASIERMNRP